MHHPFLDEPLPRALAHRGWHLDDLDGMENSLSAFRRAVTEGYRYVETDVHATADGVVVVQHDDELDRTTDATGLIRDLPWEQVRRARVDGREPVCSLEGVLRALPDTFFNIDVKADAAVRPTVRLLSELDAWDRVCLASFSEKRLRALRRASGARLLTSMSMRSAFLLWLASRTVRGLLRRFVHGRMAQVPEYYGRLRVVDERFLRTAHQWGLEVHVWTIDEPNRMRRLLDLGVDGLVTDRPDLLADVLRSRGPHTRR
ncbi:glycerophosphodiester phosphodiesterase [Allosaccharopolyspora coralli]|uniref:Glycerophosphodiester phosphodiesterase n=1 Tax=Allosaccharopolyspora coralli TaxID=2665642 RepID=A0A5Q3Q5B7_9PSEU|nr:glycerophosphodiester phosphodiesterase [Allosaccharopolyspora coralli]QGK69821.1 glycerophosphodiester phosphodiesterase [Allosaccharopolyspora coralli]